MLDNASRVFDLSFLISMAYIVSIEDPRINTVSNIGSESEGVSLFEAAERSIPNCRRPCVGRDDSSLRHKVIGLSDIRSSYRFGRNGIGQVNRGQHIALPYTT